MLRNIFIRNNDIFRFSKHLVLESCSLSIVTNKRNTVINKNKCIRYASTAWSVTFDTPAVQNYLNKLINEYKTLQMGGTSYENTTKQRLEEIQPIINLIEERNTLCENLRTLKELIIADNSKDEQFQSTVETEQKLYISKMKELEKMLLTSLIPTDIEDSCDIMLEVSAGVGGQEAMLFARELFEMYCNYVTYKQWHMQIAQEDVSELGGLRHGSILVSGKDVYQHLKFEAGVHRVQRVPSTEKSGRVHTSTVTVAVLAQPEEVDIVLQDKDLRIETKRASGAGGQHVNKTESAVRITHIPTGMSVECQVDRSQIKNREIAMRTLKARIYNQQLEEQISKTQAARKQQVKYSFSVIASVIVGSSMRSEKIRTYNYNQDRITDHRLGNNCHNMPSFLSGSDLLDTLISQLHEKSNQERLRNLLDSVNS
ncbi:Peptide chain release factor 1 [Blattella germanica]|nr:Peptide chain release factor 1 [Blattella germanica]